MAIKKRTSFTAYRITSLCTQKVYIGITTRQPKDRWQDHLENAAAGLRRKLAFAIRKHGKENFVIEAVARCRSLRDLLDTERILIAQYDSFNHGYNMTLGGDGSTGMICSAEWREKQAAAHCGRKASAATREKMSRSQKEREHTWKPSPEQRARHSAIMTGRHHTEEARQKISAAQKGRIFTAEWKAKISAAKKGKMPSPEQVTAFTLRIRGRKMPRTEEHQAKLNAALSVAYKRRKDAGLLGWQEARRQGIPFVSITTLRDT